MPNWTKTYVRYVEGMNFRVGRFAMYLLFVMMAILNYGVFTNIILKSPAIWIIEMAQFNMAASPP